MRNNKRNALIAIVALVGLLAVAFFIAAPILKRGVTIDVKAIQASIEEVRSKGARTVRAGNIIEGVFSTGAERKAAVEQQDSMVITLDTPNAYVFISRDGSVSKYVLRDDVTESFGLSPDKSKIYYHRTNNGYPSETLCVSSIANPQEKRCLADGAYVVKGSPIDNTIAIIRRTDEAGATANIELVDVVSGKTTVLMSGGGFAGPLSWSVDGERLLYKVRKFIEAGGLEEVQYEEIHEINIRTLADQVVYTSGTSDEAGWVESTAVYTEEGDILLAGKGLVLLSGTVSKELLPSQITFTGIQRDPEMGSVYAFSVATSDEVGGSAVVVYDTRRGVLFEDVGQAIQLVGNKLFYAARVTGTGPEVRFVDLKSISNQGVPILISR